jgi:hypothetical protein
MTRPMPTYIRETPAQIAYRLRNGIPPARPVYVSERREA